MAQSAVRARHPLEPLSVDELAEAVAMCSLSEPQIR